MNYDSVNEIFEAGVRNMTCLFKDSGSYDEGSYSLAGADFISFNGETITGIYAHGNSYWGFNNDGNNLAVDNRDTRMRSLYREQLRIPNDAFVIAPQNNGLTVLINKEEDEVACLRCGRCTTTCPSGLQPVRIAAAGKSKDEATLNKLHVMDCIECGLCTYICPSKIAVTENVRRAKNFIRLQGGKK